MSIAHFKQQSIDKVSYLEDVADKYMVALMSNSSFTERFAGKTVDDMCEHVANMRRSMIANLLENKPTFYAWSDLSVHLRPEEEEEEEEEAE